MDICRVCEQEFLKFGNFGNLHRHWKTVRLHTCTICDREFDGVDRLRRHERIVHSLPEPSTRGRRKHRPQLRRNLSGGLDDSTVIGSSNLTLPLVGKTSNPTTVSVSKTNESVVKKPKKTRHSSICRTKHRGVDIFSRDIFTPEPVKRKQKPRAPKKSKKVCSVKDNSTLVKKSLVPTASSDQSSTMSKSTQTEFERSETPWWLPTKTLPTNPTVVQTDPRLQKTSPPVMSDEESKLIIDE